MFRYKSIGKTTTPDNIQVYKNTKYPEIPLSSNDIYVYTTVGDSLDSLALIYYKDSSLWWIISSANPDLPSDTIYPEPGIQLRIPLDINQILSLFESINIIR